MKNRQRFAYFRLSPILSACFLIASTILSIPEPLWAAKGSCSFPFEAGNPIIAAPFSPELRISYFGKKFDYAPIRAIHRASGQASVALIETQGVRIFKIQKTGSNCKFFSSVPSAPADLLQYWNSSTENSQGEAGPEGMFVEKKSRDLRSARFFAQIALREDASRWVLLHEFMHHLFDREASRSGITGSDVRIAVEKKTPQLKQAVKSFEAKGGVKKLKVAIRAYLETAALIRQLTIRYPLEEMAIETFLQLEYRAGHFDFMPYSADVSNGYILTSAMRATQMLDEHATLARALLDSAMREGLSQLATAIRTEIKATEQLKLEIGTVLSKTDG